MPSKRIVSGALLTTVLLMSGVVAQAKTYYVEVFGDDASNCSKPAPCESISHVLDNVAGNGDRVIVGPGFYPGGLTINQTGLKLTSVAGARATTIEADGTAGITVNGDKVVVGQKKKGFTIVGSSGSSFGGQDGIYVDADKVKIEDNVIIGPDSNLGPNTDGIIETDGLFTTIRYNTLKNFEYGIYSNLSDPTRHNISDNIVSNIDHACIQLDSGDGSRDKITGNHLTNCGIPHNDACVDVDTGANSRISYTNNVLDTCYDGFYVSNSNGEKSGDKFQNNVVLNMVDDGIEIFYGNPTVSRNLMKDSDNGVDINSTDGAQIKDNLMQNIGDDPYAHYTSPVNTVFTGNTMENVDGSDGAIYISDQDTPFKKFANNNLLNLDPGACPISFNSPASGTWTLKNDFWGDLDDPDGVPDLSCNFNANTALGNGTLVILPKTTANPVKYKGGL